MALLRLPVLVIENIFSYLTYDEVARSRIVSRSFNDICMKILNRGFIMIERRHALALKGVKAQLPRRESERRYHPLARHCDILTSIETRISMLNMTYSKFIDSGICCFIPGRVLDEIRRVLYILVMSKTPPRAHEVLQELRDISSMAIEHFDDKISPAFRKRLQEGSIQPPPRPSHGMATIAVLAPIAFRQDMVVLRRRSILNAKMSMYLVSQYKRFSKQIMEYKALVGRQQKTIRDMSQRQRDQDMAIADLKKRIEEIDIKYTEITLTNQAIGGNAISACSGGRGSASGQLLRHFGSQIKLDLSVLPIGTSKRISNKLLTNMKPRKAHIKLPSLSEDRDSSPAPSTSYQSPRTRTQTTLAKIRGITNEIRNLSNLSKCYEVLPNMKPRKAHIKLPSLSEDRDSRPAPSTSYQSPRTRTQTSMAKIRGIANELRKLSNLSKFYEVLPNMKPRKAHIKLPSLSEDRDSRPAPSTSYQNPRTRTQTSLAKIRGITNELRKLSNLSKYYEGMEEIGSKKKKL